MKSYNKQRLQLYFIENGGGSVMNAVAIEIYSKNTRAFPIHSSKHLHSISLFHCIYWMSSQNLNGWIDVKWFSYACKIGGGGDNKLPDFIFRNIAYKYTIYCDSSSLVKQKNETPCMQREKNQFKTLCRYVLWIHRLLLCIN